MENIRKTLAVFAQQLTEVRIMEGKKTYSGYFTNPDTLIKSLTPYEDCNIYFVLNEIKPECIARDQKDKIIANPKNTTSDNDIASREWILIDIDSKRSAGVSASDEEKEHSRLIGLKVYEYLRKTGFSTPISADSGNGYHLLYRIAMKNTEDNKQLIKNFLNALSLLFSNEHAEIDTAVFNASRITKLYGTTARKGISTKDRPHRQSKITKVPEAILINSKELLERVVADVFPEDNNQNANVIGGRYERFNLDDFLSKNQIPVKTVESYNSGKKYLLEHCLFDHSHTGKDACIIQSASGAIGYKCLHSSCSNYKWRDVRLLFDKNAYQKEYSYRQFRNDSKKEVFPQPTDEKIGSKFLKLTEIQTVDRSKIVSIPSGFEELDRKIVGFNKGEVTLWSGNNGSGKTTILNQIILNNAQNGYKTVVFSGELTANRIKSWLQLQAAGRQNTKPTKYENLYYVPPSVGAKIDKWMSDKVFIYNNDYGNEFEQLFKDIEDFLEKNDIDALVIDNIMAIDLANLSNEQNQQQTQAILKIINITKKKNIHTHIVAHPRKAVGFLRKTDISGTANLTNAVDNVIIAHRVNQDFKITATNFYDAKLIAAMTEITGYSNIIEVCKNRDLGVMDLLVGLFYEIESKRVINTRTENPIYGWEYNEQQEITLTQVYNPGKLEDEFYKASDLSETEGVDQYGNTDLPF